MTASPTGGTPTAERPPEVVDAAVPADWVRVGRPTTVRVTVRNPGDGRTFEVEVTHDEAVVSTYTVTVAAGETAEFELSVVFDEPRTGVVAVSGTDAGELTVAPEGEPSPTPAPGTDANGGFGPASLLLAALAGVLFARRRRW